MSTTAEAAKTEGQERSLSSLDPALADEFIRIIAAIPVGEHVTVNDLRSRLDAAGIAERFRGGLFARAVKEQLLEPQMVQAGPRLIPVRIPSTGVSAHAATVRVYTRIAGGALW